MNRFDKLYITYMPQGRTAFNAYICAGDPDLETTAALIREFSRRGVDAIELGVPFSDPVADGPVIQQAAMRALQNDTSLEDILRMVSDIRKDCDIPLALMSYFNPIHSYGVQRLVADASAVGVDGLIIPDLCPEEAGDLIPHAREHDIKTIFFIAPTTPVERARLIDEYSTGFIYCVSVTGITGARTKLPDELRGSLEALREATTKPLVVGFGISSVETVRMMCDVADGVIVGSAICAKIAENLEKPRTELVNNVAGFAETLAAAAAECIRGKGE